MATVFILECRASRNGVGTFIAPEHVMSSAGRFLTQAASDLETGNADQAEL